MKGIVRWRDRERCRERERDRKKEKKERNNIKMIAENNFKSYGVLVLLYVAFIFCSKRTCS